MAKPVRSDIGGEYRGATLGDARLNRRLEQLGKAVAVRPAAGFPKIFPSEAELEAFYRFVSNDRVTWEKVLEPHMRASIQRISSHQTVLVAHDTTEFRFGGQQERDGLTRGRTGSKGEGGPRAKQGFLGHFALAVTADGIRQPLGVVGLHAWARSSDTPSRRRKEGREPDPTLPNEQERWGTLIDQVEERVGGVASMVHVLDSEADDYKLFARLVDSSRFVVRLNYDRVVEERTAEGARQKTKEYVATLPVCSTKTVPVSARSRPPSGRPRRGEKTRPARNATVVISASSVTLRRPECVPKDLPKTLKVNIVAVREIDAPDGVEPISWRLLTTEPVDTEGQVDQVIEFYRGRWVIEEFFKAIKSGCAYQQRQLESFDTLLVALAICVPVAWQLINLRSLYRAIPDAPAECCLSPRQLKILRLQPGYRLPDTPTVRDALFAVAKLGGHLKRNGDPGWQTLGGGYLELLALERGVVLAAQM